jgi:hypothetical protein
MKRAGLLLVVFLLLWVVDTSGQCSLCTKTAAQLGEKPAKGLNTGIVYLMLTPFVIVGYIAVRWWRSRGNQQ